MASWLRRAGEAISGAAALIGAFACGASSENPELPAGALVVDVRSSSEYQTGHFPGAVNIPFDQIGARIAELGEKGKPIVVYCRSGRRSGIAKDRLDKAGFTNVVNGGALDTMMRHAPESPSGEQ
jgi:rhodanese-related sulfurtransferase